MSDSAQRPVQEPVVTEVASADAFARAFFAAVRDVCHAIWSALDDGTAILLVDERIEREACGSIYAPTRSTYALVGDIVAGQDDSGCGAYLVRDGAAVRELYDLVQKRDRMAERHRQARFREIDEDVAELERVVDTLEARVASRDPMDTRFAEEWVPKAAVKRVFVRKDVDESQYKGKYSFEQQGVVQ